MLLCLVVFFLRLCKVKGLKYIFMVLTGMLYFVPWLVLVQEMSRQRKLICRSILIVEHCEDTGCLYNIKEDPEECMNLATQMPDKLKEMRAKLADYQSKS